MLIRLLLVLTLTIPSMGFAKRLMEEAPTQTAEVQNWEQTAWTVRPPLGETIAAWARFAASANRKTGRMCLVTTRDHRTYSFFYAEGSQEKMRAAGPKLHIDLETIPAGVMMTNQTITRLWNLHFVTSDRATLIKWQEHCGWPEPLPTFIGKSR